jgi:hypothetical protein
MVVIAALVTAAVAINASEFVGAVGAVVVALVAALWPPSR